ncbi:diacylglycerol/lipid kinase family protein [Streptomyces sp. Ac-502]|uniref:diacylglycerol/lipid kinase family protein n=1 Tax=Streptomyces sp. Ac-502 TaxID=3342801 RepID=UPI0038625BA3
MNLWWLVARRGALQVCGAILAVGVPVAVLVHYSSEGAWVHALVPLALDGVAVLFGLMERAEQLGAQALVAAVVAEHDLSFLVISAGTRNHFAADLGLDRADPARCLDALTDGEEIRVDLGSAHGRPYVNTVSFGAYADTVQRPEYRDTRAETALGLLPELLQEAGGSTRGPVRNGSPDSKRSW